MIRNRARAYFDGGAASGAELELDEPDWAPLPSLRIEVDGREYVYVRARQPRPRPGHPWRYVPKGSPDEIFAHLETAPPTSFDD
jgi:hypothetical protein